MKVLKKEYVGYFIFFIIIMFLSPISGDDWGNYLVGEQGIRHMIGNAIGMYFSWEGRFISRLFINLFTYNKWLWNIVNSAVIVSIIYMINSICNFKNKKIMFFLSTLIVLFMNLFTFSQVVVWIAGNITYLFVIPLILFYIKILYNDKKLSGGISFVLGILNAIIPMFVEHMAIILILLNIIFLVKYYIRNKKVNKKLVVFLIISIISFLVMFLSPGNSIRNGMENNYFNTLSSFEKIIYNIPNYIYYTYTINYFLIVLMIIGNYFIIKNKINRRPIKIILCIFNIISIIFVLKSLLTKCDYSSNVNTLSIIYFIIYSIISFFLVVKNNYNDKSLLFFLLGIISNGIMLLSPTWGYRTSFATYLFIGISYLIIIDGYIKNNKIILYTLLFMNLLGIIFYLVLYISIHLQYNDNYKAIMNGIENKSQNIEIVSYPSFAPCNINPSNDYHLSKFKKYYGINENTKITLVDNNWKFYIIYSK